MPQSHPKKKAQTVATPDLSDYYIGKSLFNNYGKKVEIVQHRLIEVGYKIPDAERGIAPAGQPKKPPKFGFGTINAIKDFQKKHGIYPDGALNGKTLMELFNYNPLFPFPSHNQDHFPWSWNGEDETGWGSEPHFGFDFGQSGHFTAFGLPLSEDAHKLSCWAFDIQARLPPRFPAKSMSPSEDLLKAMYQHEIGPLSKNFHWPEENSGVTLGPGFDLIGQSAENVRKWLGPGGINVQLIKNIDKDKMPKPDLITFLCSGKDKGGPLKLHGPDAAAWVKTYGITKLDMTPKLIMDIDDATQRKLQSLYMGQYVDVVRTHMSKHKLTQYEFDALVSFAANPPAGVVGFAQRLDDPKKGMDDAIQYWLTYDKETSGVALGAC